MAETKGAIWINEHVAAQIGYDLMEGIPDDLDKYVRSVEKALPELPVEDGVIRLREVWIETALPLDLLGEILKAHRLRWPPNVERVELLDGQVVHRPEPEEEEGAGDASPYA